MSGSLAQAVQRERGVHGNAVVGAGGGRQSRNGSQRRDLDRLPAVKARRWGGRWWRHAGCPCRRRRVGADRQGCERQDQHERQERHQRAWQGRPSTTCRPSRIHRHGAHRYPRVRPGSGSPVAPRGPGGQGTGRASSLPCDRATTRDGRQVPDVTKRARGSRLSAAVVRRRRSWTARPGRRQLRCSRPDRSSEEERRTWEDDHG